MRIGVTIDVRSERIALGSTFHVVSFYVLCVIYIKCTVVGNEFKPIVHVNRFVYGRFELDFDVVLVHIKYNLQLILNH